MENKIDDIKELLTHLQATNEKELEFDEAVILSTYREKNHKESLTIKIVSILGGLLASFAFFGFMIIAGLYESKTGLLIFGTLCVVGAIWANKVYHKIIIDTISISTFIIGFSMIAMGLSQLISNEKISIITIIPMAFCALITARTYMITFFSVLNIHSCVLTLIHLYTISNLIHLYIALLIVALTYLFLKEAKCITGNKILSQIYAPLRAALVFSFLTGLLLISSNHLFSLSQAYIWLSSLIIIPTTIYMVSIIIHILNIGNIRHKIVIYTLCLLILLPTALSPAISGALLLILLSFMVNYKTGFVLGIIAFIYFMSQYYYDLDISLLTKSVLLFSTGVFFLALYLFTHKKRIPNEQI